MSTFLFCICILILANLAWSEEPPGGYYTTRYDHLDIENILNQKRLVYYYTECLLDRGPCTPQGVEFKRILPEAIRTGCLRCTEKQRFVTLKSIRRLKKEYPEIWSQLAAVWDPTGEYVQRLEEAAEQKSKASQTASASNASPSIQPVLTASATVNSVSAVTSRVASSARPTPAATVNSVPTLTSRVASSARPTPAAIPKTSTTSSPRSTSRSTTPSPSTTTRRRTTESRIIYNYDFAIPPDPLPENRKPVPALTNVIRSVNNIIAPITDIAGKVINAGTDIAGIVLDALGVRKV